MTLKRLALTFDDGPSEWTPAILDVLNEHGARATFFVVGEAIEGREDILRRAVAGGHEIGDHTWSHPSLVEVAPDGIRAELEQTSVAIERAVGSRPHVFRPPYFQHDDEVDRIVAEAGYGDPVLCTVDPSDWKATSEGPIVAAVLARAHADAIVDFHDGRPLRDSSSTPSRQPTVDAVRQIVPRLVEQGYALVTVSELLGARSG